MNVFHPRLRGLEGPFRRLDCFQMSFQALGNKFLDQSISLTEDRRFCLWFSTPPPPLNWWATLGFGSSRTTLLDTACSVTPSAVSVTLKGIHLVDLSHCKSECPSRGCSNTRQPVTMNIVWETHAPTPAFIAVFAAEVPLCVPLTKREMLSFWCYPVDCSAIYTPAINSEIH